MADDVEQQLRELGPQALGALVRPGAHFAAAEDAVQEALIEAVRRWPAGLPDNPRGWLVPLPGVSATAGPRPGEMSGTVR